MQHLIFNAIVTAALFVGIPWLFCRFSNLEVGSSFFFARAGILPFVAALLLGSAVWTWAYELEIATLSSQRMEKFVELFEAMKVELNSIPLIVKLFCLALVPAVCEEISFRGFLLSALIKKLHPIWAILTTALLFGLFHVFVRDALMIERLVPSTFMGILLGIICWRSGSIFPGMLLHVVHNGLLITMAHYEDRLVDLGLGMADQEHLPLMWIGLALIPILLGATMIYLCRPKVSATLP